jgi:hypothetical protein
MSQAPSMKRGWMRKQARSSMIKNWQTRYFVLFNGKIAYYQDQMDRFPYGDGLKVVNCFICFLSPKLFFELWLGAGRTVFGGRNCQF